METSDNDELLPRPSGSGRLIMVLGITLPMALGAGVMVGYYTFGQRAAPAPPVCASASKAKVEPVPSATIPITLVDRAASGDYKAIDELKAKTPDTRSAEETLALAQGRSHNKGAALEGFSKEIQKNADLLKTKDQLQRLRDFFADRETTNQAAAIIVKLPGTLGPDLLYEGTGTKMPRETSQLAEELLGSKEVREKASPALGVTLDLLHAKECDEFKALLPKVEELGDRRALPPLIKLANKKGCGDTKQDDCYACLRDLDKDKKAVDLGDAIKGAKRRAPPKQ